MKQIRTCLPARLLARTQQISARRRAFRRMDDQQTPSATNDFQSMDWPSLAVPSELVDGLIRHQLSGEPDADRHEPDRPKTEGGASGAEGDSGANDVPPKNGLRQDIRFLTAYATDWRISCGIVQCTLHPIDEVGVALEPISVSGGLRALDLWMREGELVHAIVAQNSPVQGAHRLLSAMSAADLNLDEAQGEPAVDEFDDGWPGYEEEAAQAQASFEQMTVSDRAVVPQRSKSSGACRAIRRVWRKTTGGWQCKH